MITSSALPEIIQGGMGIGVSDWRLARAVSARGYLGVVSGTAVETLLVRRLQDGDEAGHMRRAMEHFPLPEVTADTLRRYAPSIASETLAAELSVTQGAKTGAPAKAYTQVILAAKLGGHAVTLALAKR